MARHVRSPQQLLARGACVALAVGSLACAPSWPAHAPEAATLVLSLEDQEVERTYRLHLPSAARAGPRPLVVALHGGGSSGAEMEAVTGFSRIADREGFIVVYPDGIGMPGMGTFKIWNPGECCSRAYWLGIYDVVFVEHLVQRLRQERAIDGRRIYVVGYSNGGALAYRLAISSARTVAAIGIYAALPPATGNLEEPEFLLRPVTPVSLMAIHSEADPRVPYRGSGSGNGLNPSFVVAGRFWAGRLGCALQPQSEVSEGLAVERYAGCDRGTSVELVTLRGWNHEWPGPVSWREHGAPSGLASFDAAERMWAFFAAHRLGG